MKRIAVLLVAATLIAPVNNALASASVGFERERVAPAGRELPPYLQCVPYARQLTGIQIYGDAHTWWQQAAGRYERGRTPKVGAVLAFQPHRNMQLGHVSAVSKVIDKRTVLLDHANWSPIDGRRGQIERDVMAVDVSTANDWSRVRVWYAPQGGLGTTEWPVHGFIYGKQDRLDRTRIAAAPAARTAPAPRSAPIHNALVQSAPPSAPVRAEPSRAFASAFAGFDSAPAVQSGARQSPPALQRHASAQAKPIPQVRGPAPQTRPTSRPMPADPIDAALARYSR
ncbi:MAG: CHAP domain-containing protein [Sphingomonadaceae bacterium]